MSGAEETWCRVTCSRSGTTDRPSSEPLRVRPNPATRSLPTNGFAAIWWIEQGISSRGHDRIRDLEVLTQVSCTETCTSGGLIRLCRFLRPDDEGVKDLSWNDKVAKKYYDNLYKEFAVCDLKHYKSGNVREPCPSIKSVTAS